MHEIALYIKERKADKAKYSILFPSGSVHDIVTNSKKLDLWLQIICDFPRPEKRKMSGRGFRRNRGWPEKTWKTIVEGWSPALLKAYQEYDRLPYNGVFATAQKLAVANQIWNEYIAKMPGFLDAVGKEPTGKRNLTESWPWSPIERKNYFIITNTDGSENGETDIRKKAERRIAKREDGKQLDLPDNILHWEAEIGLSEDSIQRIKNPEIEIHPRFDKPVSINDFKTFYYTKKFK